MTHIESRPSRTNAGSEYDFFVDVDCLPDKMEQLVASLKAQATKVTVHTRSPSDSSESESGVLRVGVHTGTGPLLCCSLSLVSQAPSMPVELTATAIYMI